jgi:hypothetical protein
MNAEELDKESLSQTDSLQPPPQGRTLRGWQQPELLTHELRAAFKSLR